MDESPVSDRVPLDPSELQPVFKFYEVSIFVDKETAETLIRTPMYRHLSPGTRVFTVSHHRIGPKRYYGLANDEFPSADQIWQADHQSQLLAQEAALRWLAVPGVRLVNVSWFMRKASSSRFTRGQALSGNIARLRNPADRWIEGEATEDARAIEQGRDR